MSLDLRRELSTYGRYLEDLAPPIAPEEYEPATIPLRQRPRYRYGRHRALVAAVGAAVLVLLAVGAATLVLTNESEDPAEEPAVTTAPPPATTSPPATTAAPEPGPTTEESPGGEQPAMVAVVDPVAVQTATAVAVTPRGEALVAYVSDGTVKLARCADSTCATPETLHESQTDEKSFLDLEVKSDGSPVLLYGTSNGGTLVACSDPECNEAGSIEIAGAGVFDLAVGVDDRPVLLRESDDRLEFLRCADVACSSLGAPSVVGPGDVGARVTVDASGSPAILYWFEADGARGEFNLVRCASSDCEQPSAPVGLGITPAPESNAVLTFLDDELPAIAFIDPGVGPRTLRCGDPECSDPDERRLGVPIPVPSAEGLGAVASGPAGGLTMTYIGVARIFMAVCADPDCATADVREISGCACEAPDLAIGDHGNPVLSYSDDAGVVLLTCADVTCGAGAVLSSPESEVPPTTPIPDGDGEWVETSPEDAGLDGASGFGSVATTGVGLIASGEVCDPSGCSLMGWVSAEGRRWRRFEPPTGFDPGNVADGGPGVVALVTVAADPQQPVDSVVFGSADGVVWRRLHVFGTRTPREDGGFDGLYVERVFAGPVGLVAYGFESDVGLVVWTSVDGEAWTRVAPAAGGFFASTPLPIRVVREMASVGSRYFMWGEIWSAEGEPFDVEVAAWRSSDLVDWEYVGPAGAVSPTSFLLSGVAWPGGLLLRSAPADEGGQWLGDTETFWVSRDGETWTGFEGDTSVFRELGGQIFPVGNGLGAITDDERGRVVWTSTDGRTWRYLDDVISGIDAIAFTGETFVGLGHTEDGRPTSWIWTENG